MQRQHSILPEAQVVYEARAEGLESAMYVCPEVEHGLDIPRAGAFRSRVSDTPPRLPHRLRLARGTSSRSASGADTICSGAETRLWQW